MPSESSSIAALDKTAAVFQHDFCPWANRWVYWLKNPLVGLTVATFTAAFVGAFVNPFLLLVALLLAAAAETGVTRELAAVVKEEVLALPANAQAARLRPEGRSKEGHFTAQYNHNRLADMQPGEADPRFRSVEQARQDKDLSTLSVRKMRVQSIENRLLTAIVTPTLTGRRSFEGLDAPWGAYAQALSPVAYAATTMDKFYRELKYAGVGEAMWEAHLGQWARQNRQWTDAVQGPCCRIEVLQIPFKPDSHGLLQPLPGLANPVLQVVDATSRLRGFKTRTGCRQALGGLLQNPAHGVAAAAQ